MPTNVMQQNLIYLDLCRNCSKDVGGEKKSSAAWAAVHRLILCIKTLANQKKKTEKQADTMKENKNTVYNLQLFALSYLPVSSNR